MSGVITNPSAVLSGDPASWPAGGPGKLIKALKPAPLGRAERIRRFGVDCGDGLTWAAGWVPGGEYTKQLVVKNVSKHMVRIKYKLPESKFFSMAFPETHNLNAGLSVTLQVRRPPPQLFFRAVAARQLAAVAAAIAAAAATRSTHTHRSSLPTLRAHRSISALSTSRSTTIASSS